MVLNTGRAITLVEPDPFTREVLTRALSRNGARVRSYEHGLALESLVRTEPPDLVMLGPRPDLGPDSIVLTRRLRAVCDTPVMVILDQDDVAARLAAFAAGADDVITKPYSIHELVARTRGLMRRYRAGQELHVVVGDITLDHASHVVERAGVRLSLRPMEFRLLGALCRNPGLVMSKEHLLEAVWGDSFSDVNLVEVHMCRLRAELERNGPRVIHTIRSVGYVLRPVGDAGTADPRVVA